MSDQQTISDYAALGADPAHATYLEWESGNITHLEALTSLCAELRALDDMMRPLEERGKLLRSWIGHTLAALDSPEPLTLSGLTIEITRPSVTKGYDRKALDALLKALAVPYPEIVAQLETCRTETTRNGGLRVTREKKG